MHQVNRVCIRTPGVLPARPVGLMRLNSLFIALWRPLHCNTRHFCSFLCGSVRSPRPSLTPSLYFLPSSLHPTTSHFRSFLCGSVRSPPSLPTLFIFLVTHFPSPHNPSPLPNTPSAVFRTHSAPYLPTLPYSPLYAWR